MLEVGEEGDRGKQDEERDLRKRREGTGGHFIYLCCYKSCTVDRSARQL